MITSDEIKRRLWDGANELRGSMDASRYKDYMLGLMFYKFLSDKTLETFKLSLGVGNLSEKELIAEYINAKKSMGEAVEKMIKSVLSYYVAPEYLYQMWLRDIDEGEFEVQKVSDSLNSFERSIVSSDEGSDFIGLFSSSTLDLSDTALGSNLHERSNNIKALIQLFADLNMVALQKGDVLGDAYEYLIGQFAMESGKKAGEFYTPHQVSEVMAQIVAKTTDIKSIYDPTVGSGSLLLTVKKHLSKDKQIELNYYGQEKNTATYNLTRMNLLLHGVRPEKMTIKNGDTLGTDWPEDPRNPNEGVQFDAVVMNPPYSIKNWNKSGVKVSDPRFEVAGVLPPDSKGDYAFLLHGLYHLRAGGTMAIVLPHGVLFRGAAEGEIRKRLIEKNFIDAIIGLPSNLFTNTGIPVVVIILKKNRNLTDPVLMIDASKGFIKVGKQNVLLEKDIAKIVDVYVGKKEIYGYSHLASRSEIIKNDYNLNIPRHVKSISDEIPHDVDAHLYGGIPSANIKELKTLQDLASDVLEGCLEELRPGYFRLNKPISEVKKLLYGSSKVKSMDESLKEETQSYISKYWNELRNITEDVELSALEERMTVEIKDILTKYSHIDVYSGYQIIAEIWKDSLHHDLELIAKEGFYNVGRMREPNFVIKGTGKNRREEQDGWISALIPIDLITKRLFAHEKQQIEEKNQVIQSIELELSELVEKSKEEDTVEFEALNDILERLNDDELGDSFDKNELKTAIKSEKKGTNRYELLLKVDGLFNKVSSLAKEIKDDERKLKDAVQERIINLTNDEIDMLVYEKWFGRTVSEITSLVYESLKNELDILNSLDKRYADTLETIDSQIEKLITEFELLSNDLVVG